MAARAPPFRFVPTMNARDAATQLLARDPHAATKLDGLLLDMKGNERNFALHYVNNTLPTVPAGKHSTGARDFLADVRRRITDCT